MNNPKEYYSLITNIDIGDVARELIGERITDESGGVLYTTDRGFARFPGLRWTNPLE